MPRAGAARLRRQPPLTLQRGTHRVPDYFARPPIKALQRRLAYLIFFSQVSDP